MSMSQIWFSTAFFQYSKIGHNFIIPGSSQIRSRLELVVAAYIVLETLTRCAVKL